MHVSSVSLWEISIKLGQGKLALDIDDLEARMSDMHVFPLPVTWGHTQQLRRLPPLHRDPFDRMLVAQAMSEPLHLLTHDAQLQPYSDLVMLV
ncbi:type II toxin-antitoxin system VapC family toxin [Methylibium sp.]|uniref:type II toxin-antitoxin system VapC family toxin n=1 Tax=Methylibium sp. TaxID=2067992 RepID=UPI00286B5181|nr:type II toxin-antitoxin system VapC family toxin [Methylibium sp.]